MGMYKIKVENMVSRNGNKVPNQFEIVTDLGIYFQSYQTVIAFKPHKAGSPIRLDKNRWDYSVTTSRYRNIFLDETTKETERKIKSGEYVLVDLN